MDALLSINESKYKKYVIQTKNNKQTIYVCLKKAMCGTLKAPLLWYILFVNTLKEEGFHVNTYNKCVANNMNEGYQFTIC